MMKFDDQLSRHYSEMLTGTYECVDRLVINGYYNPCHYGGGFRNFWRALKGSDDDLDDNHLMRMAGRFGRRVHAFAKDAKIPIIHCKISEKKYEIAGEYIPKDKNFSGIFLILVSRATALIWEVQRSSSGKIRNLKPKIPYPFVNHYWFHIMDEKWGHIIIKISSHPPFAVQIILNGHEWVEREALRKKVKITREKNCFISASPADIRKLCKIADTLYEKGQLQRVCDHWVYSCLWFGLSFEDQQKTGFRYQYNIYQSELSRNFLFKHGRNLDEVYQNMIDLTRSRLDIQSLKTIFGRKSRPYKKISSHVRIEKPLYNLTVLKLFDGMVMVKMYDKGERVLRVEVTCNNVRHIKKKHGINIGIENFPQMMAKFRQILESFIAALQLSHISFIDDGQFDQLCSPSVKGERRLAGIDLNKERCRNMMKAVLRLSTKSDGFSSKDLSTRYGQMTQIPEQSYTPRQAAYDLRKLRAKQIVQRKERSRKYHVTEKGMALIVATIIFKEKIFNPIWTGLNKKKLPEASQTLSKIDHIYHSIREQIMDICKFYGVQIRTPEVNLCKTC